MKADFRILAAFAVPLALLAAGCIDMELPTSEEVHDVFTEHAESHILELPEPHDVPDLDAGELGGWRMLCDQCHLGPNYSSHTFLKWAHNDSCQSRITCLECHGKTLHRLDVRGSKGKCIECHLDNATSIECSYCHVEGWGQTHTPENHNRDTHGQLAMEDSTHCASCHGSNNWCSDCHQIPMPHPDSIIHDHSTLVRGNPESCESCHGSKACETCHNDRGIVFN